MNNIGTIVVPMVASISIGLLSDFLSIYVAIIFWMLITFIYAILSFVISRKATIE